MTTQPRMSAPIGRVRIRTSEARKRRISGAAGWQPTDPPMEAEVTEADEEPDEGGCPRFYPFALLATDDGND